MATERFEGGFCQGLPGDVWGVSEDILGGMLGTMRGRAQIVLGRFLEVNNYIINLHDTNKSYQQQQKTEGSLEFKAAIRCSDIPNLFR